MPLHFRLATRNDYHTLENMVIESFAPITWFRRVDELFGPLNGNDWRRRWQIRFAQAFETQTVLVGEADGQIVAYASGSVDQATRLGYVDLLAVDQHHQRLGYGREMLRGMLRYMKEHGAVHAHLECLADNKAGNALYRAEGFEEVGRSVKWFIKID